MGLLNDERIAVLHEVLAGQAFVSGKFVKVFELANCERCHQVYIIENPE